VVGSSQRSKRTGSYPTVARFTENGTLDETFGVGGIVSVPNGGSGVARSITFQSDGRIVVSGNVGMWHLSVIRLNPNGAVDTTFNSSGQFVDTAITSDGYGVTTQVIGSEERVVVAGFAAPPNSSRNGALWRLTSAGRPDLSFGTGGVALTAFDGFPSHFDGVAVDSSNRIVAGGYRNSSGGVPAQLALARYAENGSLDPGFGVDGKVVVESELTSYGLALAIQSNGRILVGGWRHIDAGSPAKTVIAVWRFTADGLPDSTFGDNGRVDESVADDSKPYGYALALQADGKFVVVGHTKVGSAFIPYAFLARFWQ